MNGTELNITKCNGGIFTNFPIEWEVSKWIRCAEFLFTIVLNSVVIFLLTRVRKRSNLVFFVINLCISDLAVGVFHILPFLIEHFTSANWEVGTFFCKLKFFLSNISLYSSTYLIVIIGIDRLQSVIRPLSTVRQLTCYRMWLVISAWTLASVVCIPVLFWTILYSKCGKLICTPNLTGFKTIVLVGNAILLLFIPALVIFICYGLIVFLLCQRLKIDKQICIGEEDLLRSTTQSKTFAKANRRSTIITFVVGLTFIVCWMPYILAGLLNHFGKIGHGGWFDILNALSPLNSVLNPVIFLVFNHRMFKAAPSYKYSRTVETRV